MEEFTLRKNAEFIELNKLLKFMNWVESGGEANIRIEDGEVRVNGIVETRKRKKIRQNEQVEYMEQVVKVVG